MINVLKTNFFRPEEWKAFNKAWEYFIVWPACLEAASCMVFRAGVLTMNAREASRLQSYRQRNTSNHPFA